MMLSSLTLPIINGTAVFSTLQLSSSNSRSPAVSKNQQLWPSTYDPSLAFGLNMTMALSSRWGLQREQNMRLITRRSQAIRVLANPNVSPNKRNSSKEVVMVDPLEAKQLAAKQMAQFKAREKRKKQRQIEAINGAWAMIGLTAGLVIEGETGNSIIAQLAGYWAAFIGLFVR